MNWEDASQWNRRNCMNKYRREAAVSTLSRETDDTVLHQSLTLLPFLRSIFFSLSLNSNLQLYSSLDPPPRREKPDSPPPLSHFSPPESLFFHRIRRFSHDRVGMSTGELLSIEPQELQFPCKLLPNILRQIYVFIFCCFLFVCVFVSEKLN